MNICETCIHYGANGFCTYFNKPKCLVLGCSAYLKGENHEPYEQPQDNKSSS